MATYTEMVMDLAERQWQAAIEFANRVPEDLTDDMTMEAAQQLEVDVEDLRHAMTVQLPEWDQLAEVQQTEFALNIVEQLQPVMKLVTHIYHHHVAAAN